MNAYKAEFFTLRHLTAVHVVVALTVITASLGAALQWLLPVLLELDPPEQVSGPMGDQVDALVARTNPANAGFQLAAFDVTGSGQSSGISLFLICIISLVMVIVTASFSSNAVVWKVLATGSRTRWALGLLTAVAVAVLLVTLAVCVATCVVSAIALPLHGVALTAEVSAILLLWLRGTLAVLLIAGAVAGIVLATRKIGTAIGIVLAIVMVNGLFATVIGMMGLSPWWHNWLPTSAFTMAGGQGLMDLGNPWLGVVYLAGWCALSLTIGVRQLNNANL